jgi:hypothetical protein
MEPTELCFWLVENERPWRHFLSRNCLKIEMRRRVTATAPIIVSAVPTRYDEMALPQMEPGAVWPSALLYVLQVASAEWARVRSQIPTVVVNRPSPRRIFRIT